MKVSRVAELYGRERNLAEQTRINYVFIAKLYETEMNIQDIEHVTRESLLLWREKLMMRSTSPSTWNSYLRHIGILLKFAESAQIIRNPIDYSIPFSAVTKEKPKTVSLDNIRKVVEYLDSKDCLFKPNWFWSLLVRTLFYTGMRRRQVAGLKWQDIDFEERIIDLRAGFSKTKRSWCIPLPDPVLADLTKLRDRTLELTGDDPRFGERFVFDITLFNTRYKCKGGILPSTISNFFKRLTYLTGVRISAHRMRHTMATELATEGKYKELQQLLGHVNVHTTMKYIHPEISRIRTLVDTLNGTGI